MLQLLQILLSTPFSENRISNVLDEYAGGNTDARQKKER